MALLTVSSFDRAGLNLTDTSVAAAGGGDNFDNDGNTFLFISNGSGAGITLTVDVAATLDGLAVTDRAVSVGAGKSLLLGPFPPAFYNDGNNRVNLTYSAVTSVKVLPLRKSGNA